VAGADRSTLLAAGIAVLGLQLLFGRSEFDQGVREPCESAKRVVHEGINLRFDKWLVRRVWTSARFVLLAAGTPRILAGYMVVASMIPIGDGIIVLRGNGPKATAYGVHGGTAAAMLATALLLSR
jgi:hypothetical protein